MKLEHPELPSFEPNLNQLLRLVFEGGIDALQKQGLLGDPKDLLSVIKSSVSANRRFIRGCHYGWNLAQHRIAEHVIGYENDRRRLLEEVKIDLRSRSRQEVERKRGLISCLAERQIVLRRLADTILFHMLKMQTWIVRHISTEYRIRDIDPSTLARTIGVASELNREERLNFHLVSDLTTVVHVGDLVQVKFDSGPPEWKLIELKEGRMNSLLGGIIEKAGGELREEDIQQIREELGIKAVSQAKRMVKQKVRERDFTQLITTDEGIDILHNIRTKFAPEIVHVRKYAETLDRLCLKARSTGVEVSLIDDCFRLVALNRETYQKQGNMGIAHLLYHLQFDVGPCTLRQNDKTELQKMANIFPFFNLVEMNLHAMWPPPIFLWDSPENLVFDLLFERVLIFGQLDFAKLFAIAHEQRIDMRWAADHEIGIPKVALVIPGSPNAKGVIVNLLDKPELGEQTLLNGFFARMFVEFMSPSQFLELVREGFSLPEVFGGHHAATP
jgi:hypothetical protein